MKLTRLLIAGALSVLSMVPTAFAAIEFQEEYAKLIKAADTMAPVTGGLFGESVSLYTGGTEFTATDVSLPGNNALPVAFGRRFVVESRGEGSRRFALSDWDVELPYISAVYAKGQGWVVDLGRGAASTQRCSGPSGSTQVAPPNFVGGNPSSEWDAQEFWLAPSLYVPGQGSQPMLFLADTAVTRPTDALNYRWVTKNNWFFACIPLLERSSAKVESEEGFLVRSPDGIKYHFDRKITMDYSSLIHTTGVGYAHVAPREEVRLYPSRIEDRFGNSVTYYWSGGRLLRIEGSDGRLLTLTYGANGKIATVSDQSRTWTYNYAAFPSPNLESVTLPDTSRWEFSLSTVVNADISYQPAIPGLDPPMDGPYCNKVRVFNGSGVNLKTASITHPSGAKGTFVFDARRHGRTNVPDDCNQPIKDQPLYHFNTLPIRFDSLALISKTISGAGIQSSAHANPDPAIPGYFWTYDYHPGSASIPAGTVHICNTNPQNCPADKTVEVIDPDGTRTASTFGIRYGENEGQLLHTKTYAQGAATPMREQTFSYVANSGTSSFPFPQNMGEVPALGRSDAFSSAQLHPQNKRVTIQDGATFTWEALTFDLFAQPTRTTRGSSVVGASNVEQTVYHNNLAKWVLSQVQTVHHVFSDEATRLKLENTYSSNAQRLTESSWGKLQKIYTYHANGLIATVSDAVGTAHATALNNYFRGVPRLVTYADGSGESATVNNAGQLESVTDEQDYTTNYDYDAAGRLITLRRPSPDVVAWAATNYLTEKVASSEFGLNGSHWRQRISTGNAVKITYLDAMFRPVLTREWDTARPSEVRASVKRYDAQNQAIFNSVPLATLPGNSFLLASEGTDTAYDALGRQTSVAIDSELGASPLTTTTEYLSGFQRKVTNPRNYSATSTFMAWDEPTYEYPRYITAEDGVTTSILRDVWGNPRWVNRGGPYAGGTTAVSRRFVYDDNMRLCKVIEPEGGGSFIDYDLAGNVAWTAPAAYTGSLVCDRAAAPSSEKSTRSYDARNRLLATVHPAGTTSTSQTYFPDGALKTLTSGAAHWTYEYNKLRLLEKETLSVDSRSFAFDWAYDTQGSTQSLAYPDSTLVDYAPDAFGRPTKVGSYASNVQYHPSGAIQRFTYGNSIQHEMTQNRRLLPQRSVDSLNGAAIVDFQYGYDQNGNVSQIVDGASGGLESKALGYDKFDRLISASASGLWGSASFTYDPVDNLRRMQVGARVYNYVVDSASNRLSQVNDGNNTSLFGVGYDTRGNVTLKGTQTLTFDKANRLTSAGAAPGGIGSESYTYDGHGRRVTIQNSGQSDKRYAVYSQGGQLLHELDTQGQPINYVYLSGTLLARLQQGGAGPATPTVSVSPNSPSSGNVVISWNSVMAQGTYTVRVSRDAATPVVINVAAPTLSYTLVAPEGGTYRFDVTPCTPASLCGGTGSITNYGVTPKPVAAVNVPSVPQTGAYNVTWSASVGATGYRVDETNNDGVTWSNIQSSTSAFSISRPGLIAGSYRYRVTAMNTWGERAGVVSSTVAVQSGNTCNTVTTLPAPTLLSIVADSPTGYTVRWSESNCATHYRLQESTNGTSWLAAPGYPDPVGALVATFMNRADATYHYRVQASRPQANPVTPSAWSNTLSITITGSPQAPAIPTQMRLGSVGIQPDPINPNIQVYGNNQTVDAWWNPSPGATYYLLHRTAGETACSATDGIETIAPAIPSQLPPNGRTGIPVKRVCGGVAFTPASYGFTVQACNAQQLCSLESNMAIVEVHPNTGGTGPNQPDALLPVYYHTDALGSPVAETSATGTVTKRMRYEPYGAPTDDTYTNAPAFTGHVADSLTRLNYMQQRYYDPQLGRFLSVDPVAVNPQNGANYNRYWYGNNSPYRFIDPDGRATTCTKDTCTMVTDNFDSKKSNGQTTLASPETKQAVDAGKHKVQAGAGPNEKVGYVLKGSDGKQSVVPVDATGSSGTAATSAASDKPVGAIALVHGHVDRGDDRSDGMVDVPARNGGYGDTQSLKSSTPIPTATVSQGKVGWHEIKNGQLQFSYPKGALSTDQRTQMQTNLDAEQHMFDK